MADSTLSPYPEHRAHPPFPLFCCVSFDSMILLQLLFFAFHTEIASNHSEIILMCLYASAVLRLLASLVLLGRLTKAKHFSFVLRFVIFFKQQNFHDIL